MTARTGPSSTRTTRLVLAGRAPAPLAQAAGAHDGEALKTAEGAFFAAAPHGCGWVREETLFRDEVVLPGAHLAGDLLAPPRGAALSARRRRRSRARSATSAASSTCRARRHHRRVAYYNDSKATNVEAARRSLDAFVGPWSDHGGRYKVATSPICARARRPRTAVLAIGEAQDRVVTDLASTLRSEAAIRCVGAVERAGPWRDPGDVVLLRAGLLVLRHVHSICRAGTRFKEEVRPPGASRSGGRDG